MKKLISMGLAVVMCLSLAVPALAVEESNELTDEILLAMTVEDHERCYEYLLNYKEENPNISNAELDKIATDFYIQTYENKGNVPQPNSWYDDLLMDATGMNPDELALAKKYPSDLAAVYTSSQIANNEAESRYDEGLYLGNGDAFRHAAWNALLICRFYALGKGDFDWCLTRTREWTTAHETGATPDMNLTASQREADHDMDILNNAAGRAAAETTYTSEAAALNKVQDYVDDGFCKRIMTDAQIRAGYEYAEMLQVSSWTLRATNTLGKS